MVCSNNAFTFTQSRSYTSFTLETGMDKTFTNLKVKDLKIGSTQYDSIKFSGDSTNIQNIVSTIENDRIIVYSDSSSKIGNLISFTVAENSLYRHTNDEKFVCTLLKSDTIQFYENDCNYVKENSQRTLVLSEDLLVSDFTYTGYTFKVVDYTEPSSDYTLILTGLILTSHTLGSTKQTIVCNEITNLNINGASKFSITASIGTII